MTRQPKLIVFAGLPGTGKSTLARLVAERLDAIWLRVDSIEASLLNAGLKRSFETGLAAYLAVRDLASDNLQIGLGVVIDAVNGVSEARGLWHELETEFAALRYTIEVVCSDTQEHRRRVEDRAPPTPPLPLPKWEEVLHREYLPWDEAVLTVDGMRPPEENVDKILEYCSRGP